VSSGIIHLSDLHFGSEADLAKIEAVEELVPDLEPRVTVISGDLTLRARHGEFMAARGLIRELERTAPVFVIPGNHDVQWWWRPLIPFGDSAKYRKYSRYFGPVLAPTLSMPGVLIVSALTSHGVAWGSLTSSVRDLAVKGHLPRGEIERVKARFAQADAQQLKVLVVHHNVMLGELSRRMGLARWKQAQRRVADSGAELVLCGHDHQELADQLDGKVVVSCTGTLSTRLHGEHPAAFHHLYWDETSIQVEQYIWDMNVCIFRRSNVYAFARHPRVDEAKVPAQLG
jgi:3',5'-cyclic AMP phosphodiesterase CpdA